MVMDFGRTIRALAAEVKANEYAGKPIRTLGEVILLLQAQPQENIIKLDFTRDNPTGLDSYRGYYSDLSLEYDEGAEPVKVWYLLKLFEAADGETYTGYKCGDFTMHRKTLVWVAPYGNTGRMLTDIRSEGEVTTIYTGED